MYYIETPSLHEPVMFYAARCGAVAIEKKRAAIFFKKENALLAMEKAKKRFPERSYHLKVTNVVEMLGALVEPDYTMKNSITL